MQAVALALHGARGSDRKKQTPGSPAAPGTVAPSGERGAGDAGAAGCGAGRGEGGTSGAGGVGAGGLGPDDDEAAVTAAQVRDVVMRIIASGQHKPGDPDILLVFDAGYDLARLSFLLGDLPVQVLGRLRGDRVMGRPAPPRTPGTSGRPPKHGGAFILNEPRICRAPDVTTATGPTR